MIEATEETPEINFDCNRNLLEIKGKSYPENTSDFYKPIFAWLKKFLRTIDNQKVTVNIALLYFNSGTSRVLMDFCDILDEAATFGSKITLNWIHEEDDEDSIDFADLLQEDFKLLRLNLIEKEL